MQQKNPMQIHVEDTNAEATMAKISAIKHKYFMDEFSEEFVKGTSKKDVLIHRGYWCRFNIFHRIVSTYISKQQKCNIISLGSGYDSLPFIMWQTYPNNEFTYVEVDLPVVVDRKIKKLKESNKLKTLLGEIIISENKLQAKSLNRNYLLFGEDLCNTEKICQYLQSIDFTIPTLVYAECVLTYIKSDATNRLLDGLTKWFQKLTFLNYEMFNPNDQFGKMMVRNFEYRGCPLVGIEAFPSLQAHKDRLNQWFNYVEIYDMKTMYSKFHPQKLLQYKFYKYNQLINIKLELILRKGKELKNQNQWMNGRNGISCRVIIQYLLLLKIKMNQLQIQNVDLNKILFYIIIFDRLN